jgi:hypothetical protein
MKTLDAFIAANFILLPIASIAAFILQGPIFSFEPSVVLYKAEGIIHKLLTS